MHSPPPDPERPPGLHGHAGSLAARDGEQASQGQGWRSDTWRRGWRQALSLSRWARLWPARWPGRCGICHDWPAQPLCETCVSAFAVPRLRCGRCALAVPPDSPVCAHCLQVPPPWSACIAAVDYGWPWNGLIADFKFHGQSGLARPLAQLMLAADGMAERLAEAELVTAMPLSRQRLAARGYNQSLLLAQALAPPPRCQFLLLRLRDTLPQRSLPRSGRLANLAGAIVADPAATAQLRGRQVLLVDDVMTSGASLQAATLALLEGGADRVSVAVLARTPLEDAD